MREDEDPCPADVQRGFSLWSSTDSFWLFGNTLTSPSILFSIFYFFFANNYRQLVLPAALSVIHIDLLPPANIASCYHAGGPVNLTWALTRSSNTSQHPTTQTSLSWAPHHSKNKTKVIICVQSIKLFICFSTLLRIQKSEITVPPASEVQRSAIFSSPVPLNRLYQGGWGVWSPYSWSTPSGPPS